MPHGRTAWKCTPWGNREAMHVGSSKFDAHPPEMLRRWSVSRGLPGSLCDKTTRGRQAAEARRGSPWRSPSQRTCPAKPLSSSSVLPGPQPMRFNTDGCREVLQGDVCSFRTVYSVPPWKRQILTLLLMRWWWWWWCDGDDDGDDIGGGGD